VIYTVKYVRSRLTKPKLPYSQWSLLKRKTIYGWSENQVRARLVKIHLFGCDVFVHKRMAPSLLRAQCAVRAKEKARGYKTWYADRIDCFNWRTVRGGKSLSRHAHAIAIDINPRENPSYPAYNSTITTQLPLRVIKALRDEGWKWGGEWNQPADTMHMQRH